MWIKLFWFKLKWLNVFNNFGDFGLVNCIEYLFGWSKGRDKFLFFWW